jgi:protein O-mannosyl-transferase
MPRSGVIPSKTVLAGGVLVLAALAAYHNSFSGPFLFDDVPAIPGNETIRHLWPLWSVLSPPPGGLTVSGRPVLNLSFAINYALGGNAVGGYHAANLLIHILAGLALFGVMRRTLGRLGQDLAASATGLGFAVALIWMVHPLQTESVTYIVQRAESLMGLFYLLTLYCFIRCADEAGGKLKAISGKRRLQADANGPWEKGHSRLSLTAYRLLPLWGWLSIAACLLGMATKEVMVSAPVIVLLYDRTFISGSFGEAWRRRPAFYAGLAGTWLVLVGAVASASDRGGSAGFGTVIPWGLYVLTQLSAIVHYLRLSVWPRPLVFDYSGELARSPMEVVPAAVAVILLIAGTLAFSASRSPGRRAAGFAGIFFFAILAPTLLVPVATEIVAEHRMYLALAPVLAVVVGGGYALLARVGRTPTFSGVGGGGALLAVAIVFICLTARRNDDYRSELALWRDTLAKRPNNALAHYDLGIVLLHLGNSPEAKAQFEEAVRLAPDYADAFLNLGNVLQSEGKNDEAIVDYEKAVNFKPGSAQAHYDLGIALAQTGDISGAISRYQEALRLKPDYLEAHANLGAALVNAGRMPEGMAELEEAERLDPGSAQIHYNLGLVLRAMGREDEARIQLDQAASLQSKSENAGR